MRRSYLTYACHARSSSSLSATSIANTLLVSSFHACLAARLSASSWVTAPPTGPTTFKMLFVPMTTKIFFIISPTRHIKVIFIDVDLFSFPVGLGLTAPRFPRLLQAHRPRFEAIDEPDFLHLLSSQRIAEAIGALLGWSDGDKAPFIDVGVVVL